MASLKEIRKQKGYTLNDIAQKLGCNKQTYWNYERGLRKMPLDKAIILATILGIDIEEINSLIYSNHNVN